MQHPPQMYHVAKVGLRDLFSGLVTERSEAISIVRMAAHLCSDPADIRRLGVLCSCSPWFGPGDNPYEHDERARVLWSAGFSEGLSAHRNRTQ